VAAPNRPQPEPRSRAQGRRVGVNRAGMV
jgi:hypothetical protein